MIILIVSPMKLLTIFVKILNFGLKKKEVNKNLQECIVQLKNIMVIAKSYKNVNYEKLTHKNNIKLEDIKK